MAGKDISEKILADYNDVFADIVNVLLFNGEPRIAPDKLRNAGSRSQYKADGKLHEQERDVTKYFTDSNVTISLLGIENQSRPERFMPLRVIGYDGASYRTQLLNKEVTNIFPVVTMILYFGRTHWNYSRHLTELIDLPDDFKPFVSDYEMKNLFEISFLKPEQVLLFRSDFRYVADYFVQTRLHGDYIPAPGELDHVDAVLKLLSVLTGDHRFEEAMDVLPEKGAQMCEVLDAVENRGIEKGREEGKIQGRLEGKIEGRLEGKIEILYYTLHYSPQKIADQLHMPVTAVQDIIDKLSPSDEGEE